MTLVQQGAAAGADAVLCQSAPFSSYPPFPHPASIVTATERYIHRISNDSFEGWRLFIAGLGISEWFSVARHGSDEAAHAAALARRDRIFPHGVPYGRAFCAMKRTEGRVVGVSLGIHRRRTSRPGAPSDITVVYWIASWGRQERRRFSVLELGWEGAFRAACAERRRHTGYPVDPDLATVPEMPQDVERWMAGMRPHAAVLRP